MVLFYVLVSVTTVFEGSLTNINVTPKADNVPHSSLMDMVGKEEKAKGIQCGWKDNRCDRQVMVLGFT